MVIKTLKKYSVRYEFVLNYQQAIRHPTNGILQTERDCKNFSLHSLHFLAHSNSLIFFFKEDIFKISLFVSRTITRS